jgi:mannose-6-phosphate isomerase-like protein (cupin superfamily)
MTAEEMGGCVALHSDLVRQVNSPTSLADINEVAVIGAASETEGLGAGKMSWSHGFNVRYVTVDPGISSKKHVRHEEEVVFVHSGELTVRVPGTELSMVAGDTLTVPIGMEREFINRSDTVVEAYVVRGGDSPKAAQVISEQTQ